MSLNKEAVLRLAEQKKLWAGHVIPGYTVTSPTMEARSPIDNAQIGNVVAGSSSDVAAAVRAARGAFDSGEWANKAPGDRKRVMFAWAKLVREHAEEIAALDCLDAGKPISDCLEFDLPAVIETIEWYAEAIDKRFGRVASTDPATLGLIVKEPIGVVGAVLPWNFPAQMFAWKVAPALAAGNSVVVKPAELTSLSAYRLTQLAHQAGIPEGVLTLVTGNGADAGEALGRHPDVDVVSFTGSTEVGRMFLKYSAESNLKEIVLECGGKSAQLIFDDVNVDDIVNEVLSAAFLNMGENCSCGSRLIVHSSIKEELLAKMIAALPSWKVGLPTDPATRIGPMVEQAHFDKVKFYLDSAVSEGAKLLYGGKIHEDLGSGWYIEPTIFDDVTPSMSLFQEEIFGPILAVTSFDTEREAVKLANDSPYGLAASLYTQNIKLAHRVSRQIRAGTVSINGFSEGDLTVPFGGYKMSGFGGRDKGLEAFEQYTQTKVIWYVND